VILLELYIEEMRALGDGLSDIGRFSLPESIFEGTRRSRTRGLFEHDIIHGAALRIAEISGWENRQTCGVPQGREDWWGNGVKNL